MEYKVGDRVRMVSEQDEKIPHDDEWLGKVLTIKKVDIIGRTHLYTMEECPSWGFLESCIAGLAEEEPTPKYKVGDFPRMVFDGCEVTITPRKPFYKPKMSPYAVKMLLVDELIPIETPQLKIVILTDGTETVARLYKGKTVIESAKATCMPGDTFDFEVGAKIAMEKLLRKTGGKK